MAARKPKASEPAPVEENETPSGNSVEKAQAFRVTAPLVQAVVDGRPTQFRAGDVLPDGTAAESLDHLKSLGYVEDFDAPEASN